MKKKIVALLLLPLSHIFYQTPAFSSIVSDATTTTYGPSLFFDANYFFLGANNTNQGMRALARAYTVNTTDNPLSTAVLLTSLAPKEAFVNNSINEKVSNPIYNADIKYLSIFRSWPAVVLGTKNPLSIVSPIGTNQTIALVTDRDNGTYVVTNTEKLKDANGADTNGIVGISGSAGILFAAVSPNGGTFGGANSGIAEMLFSDNKLNPVDATTGKTGNKAVGLTSAGSNITTNNSVVMHWDESIQRLFIGLDLSSNGNPSVADALLVGRAYDLKEPKLILEPFMPAGIRLADNYDYITGFNTTSGSTEVKIHHIKTMATSTGKKYVIVAGNVYTGPITKTEVFALPIVNSIYTDHRTTQEDNVGRLTNIDNVNQDTIVNDETKTTKQTDISAIVGGGDAPSDIQGVYPLGDAVYIYCVDTDKANRGIFVSSPIFDTNGLIRAWTPWRRTMGATDNVYGMGIEGASSRFWYLTEKTNPSDVVKVTSWSIKDNNLSGYLIDTLSTDFPFDNAGVHQLFNFSEDTPNFTDFSMMVATGYKQFALVQTGKLDTGSFIPTSGTDFSTNLATNYHTFTDQALKDIGPICAAEVSRSGTEDWLFVGGYNGLAVLRQSSGAGWSGLAALPVAGYSFKKIGDFKRVHKIVCSESYAYVLTPKAVYRIELDANKFKDTAPIALNEQIIADTSYINLAPMNANDSFLDMIISSKLGILATTAGLYRTANGFDVSDASITNARQWTEVTTTLGYSLRPVTHLSIVPVIAAARGPSYNGAFSNGGNLYAVAGNMAHEIAAVVRFDVASTVVSAITNSTITPIAEKRDTYTAPTRDYFYHFGEFRSAFVTNGTFGFHTLSQHFGKTQLARVIGMGSSVALIKSYERALPFDITACDNKVGIPVQDTTSGAWIIPGDWGVKIHE